MNATDAKQPVADLAFGEVVFDVTVSGGVRWLRGLQIATALGYKNPSVDIKNLHARNADEFTPDMTQVMHLPTAGGVQQVRVFSLRGAHLLGMLANTSKAKAFRRWVLDVLDREAAKLTARPQPLYPTAILLTEDLSAARGAMIDVAAMLGMVQHGLSHIPDAWAAARSLNVARFQLEQFAQTLDGVLGDSLPDMPVHAPAAPPATCAAQSSPAPEPAPMPADVPAAVDAPAQAELPIDQAPALLPAVTAPAPRVYLSATAIRAAEIGQFVQAWREGRIVAPSGLALPYVPALKTDVFDAFVCWRNQQGMKPPMGDCRSGLLHPFKEHGLIMKGQWVARKQCLVYYPGGNRKPPEGQRMNEWLAESVAAFQHVAAELFGVGSVSHEPPAEPA